MIVIRYTDFHHQHPLWSEPSQSHPQQLRQLPHLLLADQEVQERVTEVTLDHFLPKHFSFFGTKESYSYNLSLNGIQLHPFEVTGLVSESYNKACMRINITVKHTAAGERKRSS